MSWMWSADRRKRQSGQLLPIAAAAFLVMCALAGLAVDASRDYLIKRQAQNAADFAALASSKQMTYQGNLNAPVSPNSGAVVAAHDYAADNGFPTIYSTACDVSNSVTFSATWFDVSGPSCNATTGFKNKVSVNSPPVDLPGAPVPPACQGANRFSCVQVVITTYIAELFTTALGISTAYVTVGASAQAILPTSSFDAPPPNAMVLYQPQDDCDGNKQQCFDETKPAARSLLSCSSTGSNCPTFWTRPGTSPKIYGYDGSVLSPPGDYTPVRSSGDMVIQDRTTICDSYNGATCRPNAAVGAGFAVPAGAKVYCSSNVGVVSTACTTTGQSSLSTLYASQAAWFTPTNWYPTVDTSKLTYCGGLILNGQAMYGPCRNPNEPYLIGHGIYDYIVINHGNYEFDSGLYNITGTAPVNTIGGAGYWANGIDHSQENAADFDLCTAGLPTSCPGLTAGVWIGHGGGAFSAYQGPTPGSCTNGVAGSGGGGGDATVISGSGVVFRLAPGSGGFVSTHEVSGLTLAGAGVGAVADVGGSPLLFDMENGSFIHLDSSQGGAGVPPNTTSGIIYQTPNAKSGGVEFDPSMAGFDASGNELAAIQGQIMAYSATIFGQSGGVMDFTHGYGGGSVPGIGTSGRDETSIVGNPTLSAGAPGYSVLTVPYQDEYEMDAYDVYVKINNGSPQFFSQGVWNSVPGPGTPLPPPNNNPGDANPAYPSAGQAANYSIVSMSGINADWRYAIPGGNGATIEAKGQWVWGHQNDNRITGNANYTRSGNYTAQLIYTFPNPAGNYLSVTVFFLDGDRCGDYAYTNYTFRSTGGPGPGQQSIGSVHLIQ
jgi:hypothetical protein